MAVNDEHKSLVINKDETIEVLYNQGGADTTSNPFIWKFNLKKAAKAYFVKADGIIQILELNNHALKSPMVIAVNGSFDDKILSFNHPNRIQIKVKATANGTNIEIFGRI